MARGRKRQFVPALGKFLKYGSIFSGGPGDPGYETCIPDPESECVFIDMNDLPPAEGEMEVPITAVYLEVLQK